MTSRENRTDRSIPAASKAIEALSAHLNLIHCLLPDLPEPVGRHAEHLLEAADELPRIVIADLLTDMIQFPIRGLQKLGCLSKLKSLTVSEKVRPECS